MAWDKTVPTAGTIVANSAEQIRNNFTAFEAFANLEHDGPACASPGPHKPGGTTAFYVDTLTNIKALATMSPSAVSFATDINNILYYDGANNINIGGFCPSGSKMIFYQDTAPTGWVINDTLDDKLVYVMASGDRAWNGSGYTALSGGQPHGTGTWTFPAHTHTDDGHQVTVNELPAHNHTGASRACSATGSPSITNNGTPGGEWGAGVSKTTNAGTATYQGTNAGDASHDHGITGGASYTAWRPAACCAIIATKH